MDKTIISPNSDLTRQEKADQLMENVKELIEAEGLNYRANKLEQSRIIEEYVLPGIESTKSILKYLYLPIVSSSGGLKNKLKSLIFSKIGNIAINTTERSLMRQQKYNDNVATVVEYLFQENRKLKQKVKLLEEKIDIPKENTD